MRVLNRARYGAGACPPSKIPILLFLLSTAALPRTLVVNNAAARASDRNVAATESRPLRSISAGAALAQPGDTVLVHAGVYRERVAPPRGGEPGRPIVYLAAPGEKVCVKGSEEFHPTWQPDSQHPGVFSARLDPAMFGSFNPFLLDFNFEPASKGSRMQVPKRARPVPEGAADLPLTRGQVFVDGAPLVQSNAMDQVHRTAGSWLVNAAGDTLIVHFLPDPAARRPDQRLVEITTRARIFGSFARGLGYLHVKGFIFEHAANNHPTPQVGAVSLRSGHHWLVEGNTIRYATTIGLEAGMEWGIGFTDEDAPVPSGYVPSDNVIRANHISDNGLCGIAALGHVNLQVIGNTLERNNRLEFRTWEVGGIKFHFAYYSLIEGNLVRDTDGFGIWMDNTFYKCRITRNVIVNNYFAGIFPELAHGPLLIDNNIIAYTRHGDGIYAHDSSGFTIAHNLIYSNANYGIWTMVATDRGRPGSLVTSSHQRIYDNLIFANHAGAIGLPFPFERAQDNISDANLFAGGGAMNGESTGLAPIFQYHPSGTRVPQDKITAAVEQLNPELRPNMQLWRERPELTLGQWRALTGNDKHSLATRVADDMLGPQTLELRLNFQRGRLEPSVNDELWKIQTIPVPAVTEDFYGNPVPASGGLPGPFQKVNKGANRWLLWPVTPQGRGYPLEPGEEPAAQSTFNEQVRIRHGCSQSKTS